MPIRVLVYQKNETQNPDFNLLVLEINRFDVSFFCWFALKFFRLQGQTKPPTY